MSVMMRSVFHIRTIYSFCWHTLCVKIKVHQSVKEPRLYTVHLNYAIIVYSKRVKIYRLIHLHLIRKVSAKVNGW